MTAPRALTALLAIVIVEAALVLAPASVADADVPPLQVSTGTYEADGTVVPGAASVGGSYLFQSQPLNVGSDRASWTCTVEFGDGQSGGFWRAKDYFPTAPCAAFHTYTSAGTYQASMTVTDPSGASARWSEQITVLDQDVRHIDAGVQGTPVTLDAGPGASGPVTWQITTPDGRDGRACTTPGTTAQISLTCWEPTTFTVTPAASGLAPISFEVTWSDGAPTVTASSLQRTNRAGDIRPTTRLGTGDQAEFVVEVSDPGFYTDSAGYPAGDTVTCRIDLGDGQVVTDTVPTASVRRCHPSASYLVPGTYTPSVTLDDGHTSVTQAMAPVRVVRRDVVVRASGTTDAGTSFRLRVALVDGKLSGHATFDSERGTASFNPATLWLTPTAATINGPQIDGDGAVGWLWIDPDLTPRGAGGGSTMLFSLVGADGAALIPNEFASAQDATYSIDAPFVPLARRARR